MIFTVRFLALFGFGMVFLLLSALSPVWALVGVAWNLVLVGVALADYLAIPAPPDALEAVRTMDDVLSVATQNPISVRLRNKTPRPLRVAARDEPPHEFALHPGPTRQWETRLDGFAVQTHTYAVVPPARGNFVWADVYVRIWGTLGLVQKQGILPAAAPVSVYPNLRAIGEYEMLLRRANLVRQGARRTRVGGGGREFASLREYTPDDEYRTIDWKATARRGKVISRTYEAERSQDVLLLIDLGRLMRQEIAQTQKLDHVINAGLMLAHVVAEADDRIGLLSFADDTRAWLPPRRGRAATSQILQALYAARAEPIETDFRNAFRFLASHWRKRSLAVLFTDVADPDSSAMLLAEITELARMHLVVCVVVRDPLIGERARQTVANAPQVFEKAVAEDTLSDRKRALDLLQSRGVLVVDAEPKDLSVDLVARYLDVKARSLL